MSMALEKISATSNNWGVTDLKVVKMNFVWVINNFSSMRRPGAHLKSPEFVEPETQSVWCLHSCPLEAMYPNHTGMYLMLKHSWLTMSVKFQFFLLNQNRGIAYTGWIAEADFINGTSLGFPTFIHRNRLFNQAWNLMPNDSITILCDIKITTGLVNTLNPSYVMPTDKFEITEDVANDYQSLWQNEKYSDVTLFINGKSYPGHKAVLTSRSSYFRDLFEKHAADGNNLHILEIKDFPAEVTLEVLKFIYSGKVENFDLNSNTLIAAAEKYKLDGLKKMCENKLKNAVTFPKTNSRDDMQLNGNAIEFFPFQAKEKMHAPKRRNNDDIITEIFDKVVERNESIETSASSNSSLNTSSLSNSSPIASVKAIEWEKTERPRYSSERSARGRCLGDFLTF